MSFAAIYIAEFPVAVWRRSCPELHAASLVVLEGAPPQEKIVSLDENAKAARLAHGMSKVQAEAAGIACCRTRDLVEESQAFTEMIEIVERFSPRVECLASPANAYAGQQHLAASLLVDSSGIGTLFGTAERYARMLHKQLHRAGFPAGVGYALNADAALLLAQGGVTDAVCATAVSLRTLLAPLAVSLLPCDAKTLQVLSRWGIRTLGQLAKLPETALVSRLGQQGRRLQQLACGEAERLLVPQEPPFTLSEHTALDSPLEMLDSLLFVLSPMLDALLRKAVDRAYALRSVRLTLQLERGNPHTLTVRPATPSQNRELLLKLLNLELQAHPPDAGILAVTFEAEATQPQTAQRGLFQAQFPEPDKLDLLLARLRSIAGGENVGSPLLLNTHRHDTFTIDRFQPKLQSQASIQPSPSRLALRIFRPPQPVRVSCDDSRPRSIFWQGQRCEIRTASGPWHSSGSWWDGQAWNCDLWDVALAMPAQLLRLQQEQASRAWSVIGLYD